MKSYRGIGVMSGTSLDGLDLAFCEFTETETGWTFEILQADTCPLDAKWHDRLYLLDEQSAETYAKMNIYFGHFLGEQIRDFIQKYDLKPQFVACHGQTIFHQPQRNFTAQIGDGETIASFLSVPLVTNFRNKDVALGGQGAPLVPFGEKYLFPENKVFLNLGGFANLSTGLLGFDVCPANMVLNWLARRTKAGLKYDKDGLIARSGRVMDDLLWNLEDLPFYRQKPPKSLGKEWVEENIYPMLVRSEAEHPDQLATLVEHIAIQVAKSLERLQVRDEEVMVTGGGALNVYLMERIAHHLKGNGNSLRQEVGRDLIEYKEALIFAFLGLQTLLGRPNILQTVTGARESASCGSIHLPAEGGFRLL
ncbi:MAG: anhydro-N-acetylmuramic acid kinase [Bacteroidia bacterium]|nr:anhydro-N-acetylmuramic acid kinase [Bacteroidia bacterium]